MCQLGAEEFVPGLWGLSSWNVTAESVSRQMINKGPFVLGGWTDQELCKTMTSTGPNPLPGITMSFFFSSTKPTYACFPSCETWHQPTVDSHETLMPFCSCGIQKYFPMRIKASSASELQTKKWLCSFGSLNAICMCSPPESHPRVGLCSEGRSALCFCRKELVKCWAEDGVRFPVSKQRTPWQLFNGLC